MAAMNGSDDAEGDASAQLRRALHDQQPRPPAADLWGGLSMVSRPRAVIETLRDGRGRYEEIAIALRNSMALLGTIA